MFQLERKNHINAYKLVMQLAVITESAHKYSTSEFLLELIVP